MIVADMDGVAHGGNTTLYNNSGKMVAYLGSVESTSGALQIYSKKESNIVYLGASSEHTGILSLLSYEGELRVKMHAQKAGGALAFFDASGNIVAWIGATDEGTGFVQINGDNVHDYAEVFELGTRVGVEPGIVMVAARDGGGIVPSSMPYDPNVIGVVSGAGGYRSGLLIGSRADGTTDLPIALGGQVFVRVCLENGAIRVGDLLVASSQPGVAMKATDLQRAVGAVIGKALTMFDGAPESKGMVRMFVMNR